MHHPFSLLLTCLFALHHPSPHPSPRHSSPPSSSILSISSVTPLISAPHHSPHPFICHPCVLSSSDPPPIMLHHSSVIPSSFIPRPPIALVLRPSSLPSHPFILDPFVPRRPVVLIVESAQQSSIARHVTEAEVSFNQTGAHLSKRRATCCLSAAFSTQRQPGPGENSPLKSHFVFSPSPPRWRLMHYSVRCGRSETAINKYRGTETHGRKHAQTNLHNTSYSVLARRGERTRES